MSQEVTLKTTYGPNARTVSIHPKAKEKSPRLVAVEELANRICRGEHPEALAIFLSTQQAVTVIAPNDPDGPDILYGGTDEELAQILAKMAQRPPMMLGEGINLQPAPVEPQGKSCTLTPLQKERINYIIAEFARMEKRNRESSDDDNETFAQLNSRLERIKVLAENQIALTQALANSDELAGMKAAMGFNDNAPPPTVVQRAAQLFVEAVKILGEGIPLPGFKLDFHKLKADSDALPETLKRLEWLELVCEALTLPKKWRLWKDVDGEYNLVADLPDGTALRANWTGSVADGHRWMNAVKQEMGKATT
jgi:hypothetical protein